MDEYELLIRHTEAWAAAKTRPLDTDLLSSLLHLRAVHDRRPGTSWPAGSAEHLLTVRLPGHGPLGAADPEAIVATLDTFWRFLRGTGRMASGSAEPRDLLREARRAIPTMQARAEDPAYFGQSKALQQFGAQIGITLDDLADMDDLNARMQQITDAWNALPEEERFARMPRPGSAGSLAADELAQALGEYTSNGEPSGLGPDADDVIPVQDAAVVARQARESGFLRSCLALAEWVG
ncbi:MAG TPA: hypothetical protein VHM65_07490, partial [Candidatus Lustribacter sp.]|nr:hypothetical protein [Candidatus Lustribacter sp.]